MTRVVNIRTGAAYDTYIGRVNPRHGLPQSKWANPYRLNRNATREQRLLSLAQYRDYVLSQPDLVAALPELEAKILGCWCKPLDCHGDVLIDLLESRDPNPNDTQ